MTIFGFTIWGGTEQQHIREAQRRIGDVLHGIADDLEAARQLNREQMGINVIDATPKALGGRKAKAN